MKLIDFLEVVDECSDVIVCDIVGNELCRYDGRNSVDEIYNESEVIGISVCDTDAFVVCLQDK